MAFIYCRKCDWQQDDFWDFNHHRRGNMSWWGYNPISYFLKRIPELLKPRRIKHDLIVLNDYGWKRKDPHSWWLIWWCFLRMIKKFRNQKWWTYKTFSDDPLPTCPKCGANEWSID